MISDSKGLFKAEKYGWSLNGNPPELGYVELKRLKVDPSYQRDEHQEKSKRIARSFDWGGFASLSTAKRVEDTYYLYVFDGGHRAEAARLTGKIDSVPCTIHTLSGPMEEARMFLLANTERKSVLSHDKFKAKLVTKDEAAVFILNLVEKIGYRLSKSATKGTISCVAKLEKLYRQGKHEILVALPLCAEICDGEMISEKLIGALCYIERTDPGFLSRGHVRNRLKSIGSESLGNAMFREQNHQERGHDQVWAKGVLAAMNKGQRSNRFYVIGINGDDAPA